MAKFHSLTRFNSSMMETTSPFQSSREANIVVSSANSMGKKGESLLWPGASQWRIYYHRMWDQLSTTCNNVLKQPTEELLVAVNHNQLLTMASDTLDPIDWSHPPPSWAVPPERLVHSINQCNIRGNRTCNRSMRGNHLATLII